jgi:type II secretory pathway predicted ATPase ExeA
MDGWTGKTREASTMNEGCFGLRHRPFPATPDLACYYPASSHERCLAHLLSGLADGESVLLLVGGPGTGKTLLCHRLLEQLGAEVESVCLTHTHLPDRCGLLQAILFDLSLPHAGKTEQEMRLNLIDHLLRRFAAGKRTVLVIDEAQHLGTDLLEEVRLLGNLEGSGGRAIQVVLVGQPELLDTLGAAELGSLRQRLAVRAALEPLDVEEAADYLLHHVRAAGGKPDELFAGEALELLARNTHGLPRLLNQAAHQALRLAASAGADQVDAEAVLEALTLLGLSGEATTDEENAGMLLVDSATGSEPLTSPEEEGAPVETPPLVIAPGRSA